MMKLAPITPALLPLLTQETKATNKVVPLRQTHKQGSVREGGRNTFLISLAGKLRRRGVTAEQVLAALLAANENFEPPLPEGEVRGVASSSERYPLGLDFTEHGVSDAVAGEISGKNKFSPTLGWVRYGTGVWIRDPKALSVRETVKRWLIAAKAKVIADQQLTDKERASLLKRIDGLRKNGPIKGIVALLESDPDVQDEGSWEEGPNVLNFRNCTVKLPSLEPQEHRPEDRLMKQLDYDYDPGAACPAYDRVLASALGEEVGAFVCRLFGQALTGEGGLQKIAVFVGPGRNGKSTVMEAVAHAFGAYAVTAAPTTFVRAHNKSAINNDVAALCGARLVCMSELNSGQTLDAAIVKRLTGGDKISARFLRQEFFEFELKGLVVMISNYVPRFDGSDTAMARRSAAPARTVAHPSACLSPQRRQNTLGPNSFKREQTLALTGANPEKASTTSSF